MGVATASKYRLPTDMPLLLAIDEGGAGSSPSRGSTENWVLRLRSSILKKRELSIPIEVLRTEEEVTFATAKVPQTPPGFYRASVVARSISPLEMPLLILDRQKLEQGTRYVLSEAFEELEQTKTQITATLRSIFRERIAEVAAYDSDVEWAEPLLENLKFDSLLPVGAPASRIYFLAEAIAGEFAYLAPLGIRHVECRMEQTFNRVAINLLMTCRTGLPSAFRYVGGHLGDLSLIGASGALEGFKSGAEMVDDLTFRMFASFLVLDGEPGPSPRHPHRQPQISRSVAVE